MSYNLRPIQYVKGVGDATRRQFLRLGVDTFNALIHFYPRAYEDWSAPKKIADCVPDETAVIKGKITSDISVTRKSAKMVLYRFTVFDKTGVVNVTIFNNRFLAEKLKTGNEYLFYGKLTANINGRDFNMSSPQIKEINECGIYPIYALTKGLYNKTVQRIMKGALNSMDGGDYLPTYLIDRYRLGSITDALNNVHFPVSAESLQKAKRRLSFDELFLMRTGQELIKAKTRIQKGTPIKNDYFESFKKGLPFTLTASQEKAVMECLADMKRETPMQRLLQGDVGSGKTVVAAALIDTVAKNGQKSVLMAPTGVLAHQHFKTFCGFLPSLNIALLDGHTKKSEKEKIKAAYSRGEIDLLIGTHAVITESTDLSGTALCITDEQHRFGVKARAKLSEKSGNPHTLYMSATPIPRTLGLIIYGELDISIIDELPRGRVPVESFLVKGDKRKRIFEFIKKEVNSGHQAYIICPLVEEGETDRLSAEKYYEKIKNGFFKDINVGLIHGKMSDSKKDEVMSAFKQGEIKVLVATTIIEVGVDNPNATVMLVENAECFGLATLHQLRGRIGRGSAKSTFIMISEKDSERLTTVCKRRDGFKIAEEDLKLRGPGEFLGHRQHGLPELKMADFIKDSKMLKVASDEAVKIVKDDPTLSHYPALLERINEMFFSLDLSI